MSAETDTLADLRARLAAAEGLLDRIHRCHRERLVPENGDWACAECKPHSDMLVEGFRCAYHELVAWYGEQSGAPAITPTPTAAEQALATVTAERDELRLDVSDLLAKADDLIIGKHAAEQQLAEVRGRFDAAVLSHEILERERNEAQRQLAEVRVALEELTAVVRGECPSLLDEDSGGDAELEMRIAAILALPASPPRRTEEA